MPTTIARGIDLIGTPSPITITTTPGSGFSMAGAAGALIVVLAIRGGATKLTYRTSIASSSTDTPASFISQTSTTPSEQVIAANTAFELPGGLFAAPWIMPVTDAGEADIRVIVKT